LVLYLNESNNRKRILNNLYKDDYKDTFYHMRSVFSKSKPEWEDIEVYDKYIMECAVECKANKTTGYGMHVFVARMPANPLDNN
jgi:hypothetical protein